ncbi:beta-lactamase regulating signal transducer with metallopeptidase domain [Halospina denitrificans]|uniref:Beta-lactamase regulating signal transducer with metallopeptidase domain n=1 Tax=Halospina denitrificans TaxID=332522 RepID=A0A4R7JZE9_9GAMM|nr:M56 family metallopeptidase [Halospina denitrificans]TDT43920.1 beta-lactamase regulating signal transducer with metallopeptidase domain [Halospina denitrificans]
MASLMLVFLKVVLVGAVATALLAPLLGKALMPVIRRLPPPRRAAVLLAACWLPLLGGVLLAAVVAGPSIASLFGLYDGHCPAGAGASHHHCVLHPGTELELPWASLWLGLIGGGLAMLLARNVLTLSREYRSYQSLVRMARGGSGGEGALMLPTERPFAGVLGLLHPRMVLSNGLVNLLSASQRRVVEAHESAHCARRDPLLLLLARFGALLHLPAVRRVLLQEFLLATEQTADERAAIVVGDRLMVAETILAVARANPYRVGDLAFTGGLIDERVEALVSVSPAFRPRGVLLSGVLVLLLVAVMASPAAHHALESFLSSFLG